MTRRLFHIDSYLKEFTGSVAEQTRVGDRPAVVLDQTAFYATSGGQPFDTGVLGSARVIDVVEDEAGDRILHVIHGEIPNGIVRGEIDWERRFDHMQQHTGQHILSQAFVRVGDAPTVSFHLGARTSTIDLELVSPLDDLMQQAEALATRIVFEDRPVHLLRVGPEELSDLGVRKQSDRQGQIRVIDIEGFDRSPCGGTHVNRTGEIGMIGILGYERYKGGTRVEFVCGGRALLTLRRDHETLKALGKLYSADLYEVPRLAEKFFEERTALARENLRLREELLAWEARDLRNRGREMDGFTLVRMSFQGQSLDNIRILARKIVSGGRAVAILAAVTDSAQIVVARSADAPGDCARAIKEAAAKLGGRGGGKPDLAQAGGIAPNSVESWLDSLEASFRTSQSRPEEQR